MAIGNFDQHADGTGARRQSGSVNGRVIAANTAESIDIPDLAKRVILAANTHIYFSMTGTAVVPSDADTEALSEMLPASYPASSRTLLIPTGATAISVITDDTNGAKVTAAFFMF